MNKWYDCFHMAVKCYVKDLSQKIVEPKLVKAYDFALLASSLKNGQDTGAGKIMKKKTNENNGLAILEKKS